MAGDHICVSIVIASYNRRDVLLETMRHVLSQETSRQYEVVVVDDGSTDGTYGALQSISDDRVVAIRRENGGLCAARNTGIGRARGRWIIIADDDDIPLPGWIEGLTAFDSDPVVGCVSCAATLKTEGIPHPRLKQPAFVETSRGTVAANYIPGTLATRRELEIEAGGYLEGLGWAHSLEHFYRIAEVMQDKGWREETIDKSLIEIHRKSAGSRPLANPVLLFDGSRWLLARHDKHFRRSRRIAANTNSIIGVNAARIGRWRDARRYFVKAVSARPFGLRELSRCLLSTLPGLAERIWGGNESYAKHQNQGRGFPSQAGEDGGGELFLPWRYKANVERTSDAAGNNYWAARARGRNLWQVPVYRLAARLAGNLCVKSFLDVGCGTGQKLMNHVRWAAGEKVGFDQASAIALARKEFPSGRWIEGDLEDDAAWRQIKSPAPRMVVCADVIEHVERPVSLLRRLRTQVSDGGYLLISTPDRHRLEGASDSGPPTNPSHIREWSMEEFFLLLESTGFEVMRHWSLFPRSYELTFTEIKRTIHRAVRLRPIPDPRRCMVFLCQVGRIQWGAGLSRQGGG